MDNTISHNLKQWNENHKWPKDGDEWDGQAKLCGVSYDDWKHSLIDALIIPNATGKTVMEIAPGHGRWMEHIVKVADRTIVVDLSPNCIAYCRERFGDADNIEYHVNDGRSLPQHLTNAIDFIWSYDSFVHMNADVIKSYFEEISRVLGPGGIGIIHHGNRHYVQLAFLRRYGNKGRQLFRKISQGFSDDHDGWRSNVSASMIARMARRSDLSVKKQIQYWKDGKYGVPRFNDRITIFTKT